MLYLEQMLLKHNVCEKAQSIKEMPGGMDIYWGSKSGANHLIEFLKGVVPIRSTIAKKLISQDDNVRATHPTDSQPSQRAHARARERERRARTGTRRVDVAHTV